MTHNDSYSKNLRHSILTIAVPISLQSLFQSSLSVIDQIMVGQLGTVSITSIGLGSKFPNLYLITLSAIGAAASIMISQYCGNKDPDGVNHSFVSNGLIAFIITGIFIIPSALFPVQIMNCYSTDPQVIRIGAEYLRIISIGYLPLFCTAMLSAILRNTGNAKSTLFAGIISVAVNTLLSYIFIFGKFGAPKLGVTGTAIATTAARTIECLALLLFFHKVQNNSPYKIKIFKKIPSRIMKQTLIIASPIVLNEFLWGMGDTMYAVVYGHMSTEAAAAMTLTQPMQNLTVGLLTGISTAAAIMVGNHLGKGENDTAYTLSCNFIKFGAIGAISLGVLLSLFSGIYSGLFNVPLSTKQSTVRILYAFSIVLFFKVTNMIMAGGILRSGGKTKYTLFLDSFGTYIIGIPMGFLSAFVWNLPIEWVYFLISTEEMVRTVLGAKIFKSKRWIKNITETSKAA